VIRHLKGEYQDEYDLVLLENNGPTATQFENRELSPTWL
jgi:hypothetical protein